MFREVNRIIFDLDGTLIKHDFERENTLVNDYLGIDATKEFKEQLRDMFDKNINYIQRQVVTQDKFAKVIEEIMPILKEYNKTGHDVLNAIAKFNSGKLMDEAKEILEYLRNKKYQLVVLTNWFYDPQISIMKKLDILDYFEKVYAWDYYYPKPNYLAMLRALGGTDPKNNIIIGDDAMMDINQAAKMGIHTIGYNIDYNKVKLPKKVHKAEITITSLLEIKEHL